MWVFSVKIAIAHSVPTGLHRRIIKRGKWFGICSLKEEIVAKNVSLLHLKDDNDFQICCITLLFYFANNVMFVKVTCPCLLMLFGRITYTKVCARCWKIGIAMKTLVSK